jgi:YggT family protein
MLPDMGGVDISPVVLILACMFVQLVVIPNVAKVVT